MPRRVPADAPPAGLPRPVSGVPAAGRPGPVASGVPSAVVLGRHHRPEPKPFVRGNTVVGATVALGAVVTGSLLAIEPSGTAVAAGGNPAEALPASLASEAQPLALQQTSAASPTSAMPISDFDLSSADTTLLPVALDDHSSAKASNDRDVEMLHKADRMAAEAAALHAIAAKEASVLAGGGDLDDWINVALVKLDLPTSYAPGVKKIIMKESRGNPHAVNRWDSNALAGRPSQGLMQTIPSTFRAYVLPELAHLPITNPVANITAGLRYMIANYGESTVRGGGRSGSDGGYIGY
jgi:soluble lytic murein transglycosylase-like protein